MKKYQNFLSENFPFLVVKFSIYLNRRDFVMRAASRPQQRTNNTRTTALDWLVVKTKPTGIFRKNKTKIFQNVIWLIFYPACCVSMESRSFERNQGPVVQSIIS